MEAKGGKEELLGPKNKTRITYGISSVETFL